MKEGRIPESRAYRRAVADMATVYQITSVSALFIVKSPKKRGEGLDKYPIVC
jgi:hypothetical protein